MAESGWLNGDGGSDLWEQRYHELAADYDLREKLHREEISNLEAFVVQGPGNAPSTMTRSQSNSKPPLPPRSKSGSSSSKDPPPVDSGFALSSFAERTFNASTPSRSGEGSHSYGGATLKTWNWIGQRESQQIKSESGVFNKFRYGKGGSRKKLARFQRRIFLLLEKDQKLMLSWQEQQRWSMMLLKNREKSTKVMLLERPHALAVVFAYRDIWDFSEKNAVKRELCFIVAGKDRDLELCAPNFSQLIRWVLGLQYLIFQRRQPGLHSLQWNFKKTDDINNNLIMNAAGQQRLMVTRRLLVLRYIARKLRIAFGSRKAVANAIVRAIEERLLQGYDPDAY